MTVRKGLFQIRRAAEVATIAWGAIEGDFTMWLLTSEVTDVTQPSAFGPSAFS